LHPLAERTCFSQASGPWLYRIDAAPAGLEAALAASKGIGRVANYHAALLMFWLQHWTRAADSPGSPAPTGTEQLSVAWGIRRGCYFRGPWGSHRTPWHPTEDPLNPLQLGKVRSETHSH
jgi:hypothetical protein